MKVSLFSLLFLCYILSVGQDNSGSFQWPENYKVAVCLTYDDGLDCHLDVAVPALDSFGFKGTFYCTGYSHSLYNRLHDWRAITENGHELGNHTLFHPCDGERFDWVKPEYDLRSYSILQIKDELFTANSLLKAVDGKDERTYAYTCSDYMAGSLSYVDSIRHMFVSARSDGPIPESIDDIDLHFVSSWGVIDPSGSELIEYVKKARDKGTIAIFMFHSVGGGYLNVSSEAHDELLTFLNSNKDEIWIDTFINVMRYIKNNR